MKKIKHSRQTALDTRRGREAVQQPPRQGRVGKPARSNGYVNPFKGKDESETQLPIREMVQMIRSCEFSSRNWYFLLTLALTGARVGELVDIRVKDVDVRGRFIARRVSKRKKPMLRRVAVGKYARLFEPVVQYNKPHAPLFGLSVRGAQELFKRIHRKAVPSCRLAHSIHSARHWNGTVIYQATKDLLYVKYRLGHKPSSVTERYTNFDESVDAKRWTDEVEPFLKRIGL